MSASVVRFACLALCTAAALLGCSSPGDGPVAPGIERARDEDGALRRALSREMSDQRVVRYSEAWHVLSDGSEVAPGAIRLFYTRRIMPAANRASGDDQAERDFWNREHVWPQSAGLKGNDARTDLHNLVPVDRTVNSSRGAKLFGEASTPHHECRLCRVSRDVWEPPSEVQGDVARILFYMDVRYEGHGDEPDLVLSDSASGGVSRFGGLSTFFRWHCADPVSDEERRRHESVARAQGNRNAFVDSPGTAEVVFGFSCRTPLGT